MMSVRSEGNALPVTVNVPGDALQKVLVNATPLLGPLTGIGQYIRHLMTAMDRLGLADVSMIYGGRVRQGFHTPAPQAAVTGQRARGVLRRVVPFPRTVKRLAEGAVFRLSSRGQPANAVYHEPNYLPLPYRGPLVLTICDMSCLDHPQTHPLERVRLIERHLPSALQRAHQIIVISRDAGRALQRWFAVPDDRITVTHLAADERFKPRSPQETAAALQDLGLAPGGYVLSVGTLEPRKNLGTLFAAYGGLPEALRKRFPLVVAGMKGWRTETLMQEARVLAGRGDLRLLGYVPDETLPALFAGAAAFCYPSRYEGFGLPALEAMASGVPVLTSNLTSLPEVVGDAGLMVDPDDVGAMRGHLQALLEDRSLADRLGSAGLLRAQTFSWEHCARQTAQVYRRAAGGAPSGREATERSR